MNIIQEVRSMGLNYTVLANGEDFVAELVIDVEGDVVSAEWRSRISSVHLAQRLDNRSSIGLSWQTSANTNVFVQFMVQPYRESNTVARLNMLAAYAYRLVLSGLAFG